MDVYSGTRRHPVIQHTWIERYYTSNWYTKWAPENTLCHTHMYYPCPSAVEEHGRSLLLFELILWCRQRDTAEGYSVSTSPSSTAFRRGSPGALSSPLHVPHGAAQCMPHKANPTPAFLWIIADPGPFNEQKPLPLCSLPRHDCSHGHHYELSNRGERERERGGRAQQAKTSLSFAAVG